MLLADGSTAQVVVDPSGIQTVIVQKPYTFDGLTAEPLDYDCPFRVVVPHTAIHPATMAGVPRNAEWVNVSASPHAYLGALTHWWADGRTFMVVEHDVTCRREMFDELDACPELWCTFPYLPECPCGNPACREAWRNQLGATRFRAELIAAVPDAMHITDPDLWDWHNVCDGLGNNLRAAGFTHHWHEPGVEHHRSVQRDGLEEYV